MWRGGGEGVWRGGGEGMWRGGGCVARGMRRVCGEGKVCGESGESRESVNGDP